ncbi:O-antigen ligase family protein [Bdellovibrio sp.]|uniref:O-antigen ligase family protein n=1 Tax=Bdellovibrio sp. TaxID=28201 RepID=UPI0039E43060
MREITIKNKYVESFWKIVLFLFCVSVYTSKSGLSIFGVLLILLSAFYVDWKDFGKQKFLVGAVTLYPLAILCNLFSLGGVASSLKVVYSWPWPLLVIPAYLVSRRPKDWRLGFVALALGFIIACGKSLYTFITVHGGVFSSAVRVDSFWDIGRWGVFLAVTTLALFGVYGSQKLQKTYEKVVVLALFALGFVCLILSNTRAPWLAFGVGFTLYCFSDRRLLKYYFGLFALVLLLVFSNSGLRDRTSSIGSIKTDQTGQITSGDPSNAGRLHMWKVAMDFYREQPWFGTGFESVEAPLRAFLDVKGSEYKEKYTKVEFSFRDQHSSYFGILVQMGVLFFLFFWFFLAGIFFKSLRDAIRLRDKTSSLLCCILATHFVIFVFYSSFGSYEMISLFPFLALRKLNQ